jgi:hypothetical protein
MKKFQFLLLDAGPIIKLFELGVWDEFVKRCDVTVCRTVAEEAQWASQEFEDVCIDLEAEQKERHINIIDVELSVVQAFYDRFSASYQAIIHNGEKETLAFLDSNSKEWLVCAADKAVFKVLGSLGRTQQGISLEEVLEGIGLAQNLDW